MAPKDSTGLLKSLRLVYSSYGGTGTLIRSGYLWASAFATIAMFPKVISFDWPVITIGIMPTLIGFTIAAFAIYFSVIDEKMRNALKAPADELGGRSPLMVVYSGIVHAVIVQITALIYALVANAGPIDSAREALKNVTCFSEISESLIWLGYFCSGLGLLISNYGVILILASALSMFNLLHIKSKF